MAHGVLAAAFLFNLGQGVLRPSLPLYLPLHGIAIGWLRTVTDAGMLLGPVMMEALADAVHVSASFLAAAVLLCVLGLCCRRPIAVVSVAS